MSFCNCADCNYVDPPQPTEDQVEAAKAEILDDDQLLDDFAEWQTQISQAATGQYTRMVKLVRDESSTGFAHWQEQHHAKAIDERAAELADLAVKRAREEFQRDSAQAAMDY